MPMLHATSTFGLEDDAVLLNGVTYSISIPTVQPPKLYAIGFSYVLRSEDYTNTSHTIRIVKLDLMPYSMIES